MSAGALISLFRSHWQIAAALLLLLFLLWTRFRKQKKERIRQEELVRMKRRDEALSEALRNPLMKNGGENRNPESPVGIHWDEEPVNEGGRTQSAFLLELTELTSYARKQYVIRLDSPATLGSGDSCTLSLQREGVAPRHCELRSDGTKVTLKSMPGARTVLRRKKTQAEVGTSGVYLRDGDCILMGKATVEVRFIKGTGRR